jgi:hypothetical protein
MVSLLGRHEPPLWDQATRHRRPRPHPHQHWMRRRHLGYCCRGHHRWVGDPDREGRVADWNRKGHVADWNREGRVADWNRDQIRLGFLSIRCNLIQILINQ